MLFFFPVEQSIAQTQPWLTLNTLGIRLKGYVSPELNRLFRAVVALKDKNLSDRIAEALEDWLNKPQNHELNKSRTYALYKLTVI